VSDAAPPKPPRKPRKPKVIDPSDVGSLETSAKPETPAGSPAAAQAALIDEAAMVEATAAESARLRGAAKALHQEELDRAQALARMASANPSPLSDEARKARNRRNLAIAGLLIVFVVLVFIATIVNLSGGAVPHK
jgi:hypothetical protein